MSDLNPRERELVALGAALASNCIPCIEYHIREARRVGLGDPELHETIRHADMVRQVPARNALQAAWNLLPSAGEHERAAASGGCCASGIGAGATQAGSGQAPAPQERMMSMMSSMMETCAARGASGPVPGAGATGKGRPDA